MPEAERDQETTSILFTDIRGYTRISTVLRQDMVVYLLENWVSAMSRIILEHDGTVDKLLGDGMLARFDASAGPATHATRAVAAAIDMQRAVEHLGTEWRAAGPDVDLEIRIGIATGSVGISELEVDGRLESTVLGSHVNLAARLQDRARPGGILISEPTHAALGESPRRRIRPHLEIKGFDDAYTAWEVDTEPETQGTDPTPRTEEQDQGAERRRSHRQPVVLELRFKLNDEWHTRSSVNVSEGGIFIAMKSPAEIGITLDIRAKLPTERGTLPVILGGVVVRHGAEAETHGMGVRFTSASAEDVETLHYFVSRIYRLADLTRSRLVVRDGRAHLNLRSPHAEPTLAGRPLPTSHDRLGAGDRGELERRIAHEYHRTVRYGHEFSCVAVRVESLGRLGDLALAASALEQLAAEVAACIRNTDELFFVNEATFLVLAPETMANRVSTLLARIVEGLHGLTIGTDLSTLDVRAGAFSFDGRNAQNPDELLERALDACPQLDPGPPE